jgi:hypothetical protein
VTDQDGSPSDAPVSASLEERLLSRSAHTQEAAFLYLRRKASTEEIDSVAGVLLSFAATTNQSTIIARALLLKTSALWRSQNLVRVFSERIEEGDEDNIRRLAELAVLMDCSDCFEHARAAASTIENDEDREALLEEMETMFDDPEEYREYYRRYL